MKLLADLFCISGIQTSIDKDALICILEKIHFQEDVNEECIFVLIGF
jgi:hypothetical protein